MQRPALVATDAQLAQPDPLALELFLLLSSVLYFLCLGRQARAPKRNYVHRGCVFNSLMY